MLCIMADGCRDLCEDRGKCAVFDPMDDWDLSCKLGACPMEACAKIDDCGQCLHRYCESFDTCRIFRGCLLRKEIETVAATHDDLSLRYNEFLKWLKRNEGNQFFQALLMSYIKRASVEAEKGGK